MFLAAHRALSEAAEVEQSARDGDQAERDAKALVSERRKLADSLIPPWTAHDEWKRLVKKIERPEPLPEVKAACDLARAELATAEAELIQLQETVRMCHAAVGPARKHAAGAWEQYHSTFPPKTAAQVHRDLMERDKARKLAGTDRPRTAPPQFLCELDRSMSVRGGSRRAARHPDASGRTYDAAFLNHTVEKPAEKPWEAQKRGPRS